MNYKPHEYLLKFMDQIKYVTFNFGKIYELDKIQVVCK